MQKKNVPVIALILILTGIIAGYGCSSSKKNQKQDKKSETAMQDSTGKSSNDLEKFKKMSPDHVAIKGHVLMFNENKPEEAIIKINQILGYGSGTPMLAAGQRIRASITNSTASDTTKGTDIKAMLTSGKTMIFILNHAGEKMIMTPSKTKQPQPEWRIQSIQQ